MKLTIHILPAFLFFITSAIHAQSIQTKKITIPGGKDSLVLKSTIKGSKIIDYKIDIAAGETIKVNLKTNNTANYFNVLPPGSADAAIYNSSIDGNNYTGNLQTAGEYTIRVYLFRSAARRNESANFTLTLSLEME